MGLDSILKKMKKKKNEDQNSNINSPHSEDKKLAKKKKQKEIELQEYSVMVKEQELDYTYNDYLSYIPEIHFSFLPGVLNKPIYIKILAILFYAICIMFIIDGNYLVSIAIYLTPLIINGLRIKKVLKENELKPNKKNKVIAVLIGVVFLSSVFTLFTTDSYNSSIIANNIINIAERMEKDGFRVDKYAFYNVADIFSGHNPLPYYKKGIYLFERGDLEGAKEYIEKAFESDIVNYQVHYLKGKIAFLNEEYKKSKKNFEIAYEKNDVYVPTLHDYAMLLLNQGDIEQAEILIEEAMDRAPNNFEVNRVKANIFIEKGMYKEALNFYDRAISANPGISHLHTDKARALVHMSRLYEAEGSIEIALRIDENSLSANLIKGKLLYNQNKYEEAIDYLDVATRANEEGGLAHAYLALCYLKLGNTSGFESQNQRLSTYDGIDSEIHYVKSIIYLEKYELQKALDEIKEAIELNSSRAKYYSLKADIYFEMDEFEKLERANSDAWIIDENDLYAYYVRAKYMIYLENFQSAHETFETMYKRNNFSARAHAGLAYTYNALNERELAYELMITALELDPKDYYVYYMKALLDFERRRFESSLVSAQRGLDLNPKFYRLNLIRAKAFYMTDRPDKAIKELEKLPEESREKYTVLLMEARIMEDDSDAIYITNTLSEKYPNRFESYVVRAQRFFNMQDYNGAQNAINQALRLLNTEGDSYESLSEFETADSLGLSTVGYSAYLTKYNIVNAMGNINERERVIDELIAINPYFKDAYYYKGRHLQEQGYYVEAEEAYKMALEIDSNFHICEIKDTDVYARLIEVYDQLGEAQKQEDTEILLERILDAGLDLW